MGHRYDALASPATPVEVHGVRSDADYLRRQRRFLSDWARVDPTTAREPFEAGSAVVEISGWKWIVWCACGGAPSGSPAWARVDPPPAREPFEAGSAVVEISGWKWIVWCACGDAPSASPAWDVARCGRCGAVYRGLVWPAAREALCAVLRVRPGRGARTWHPGETLERLRAENAARGLRDREEDP